MQIIIWGTGKYYINRKEELTEYLQKEKIEVVAFCDNNTELWDKQFEGIRVVSPETINKIHFDAVLIMSTYVKEIELQLLQLGIGHAEILFWEVFRGRMRQRKKTIYCGKQISKKHEGKQILIISVSLGYAGGQLAAVYTARVLQDRKYDVVLAASCGEDSFIKEAVKQGITVVIYPSLPYICEKDSDWLKQFDIVIVNTFPMLVSAYGCAMIKPTIWWIHEAMEYYGQEMSKPWNRVEKDKLSRLNIYAVSSLAKENFDVFSPGQVKGILPYGIPDVAQKNASIKQKKSKIIFAIIGDVCDRKAQDIFVDAACQLSYTEQAEFWIIGKLHDDAFGKRIKEKVSDMPYIRLWGVLTREKIYDVLREIDVVVCVSREDPLPIVVTEGMMFGKICIISDKTGSVDYIHDGTNGFVVPANDIKTLKEKMGWIVRNYNSDSIQNMGICARETYEKYFTMDIFGDHFEKIINEI